MLEQWLSIAFGAGLVVTAAVLLVRERANWVRLQTEPPFAGAGEPPSRESSVDGSENLSATERLLDLSRSRRRMQVAALLGLIGLMIALGDSGLIAWERHLVAFVWYWLAVVVLTLWMALLACADLMINRLLARSARGSLARLEEKRNELLAAADRLREHREGRRPNSN